MVAASGVELRLARPPGRIVSLLPSATETLCALGLGDALVGVTVYCAEPRALVRDKARVGGTKDPDLTRIRALAPDLVVANMEENERAHVAALREWSIPVWVTYPRTVAEGIRMIRELGEITGTSARAAAIAGELEAALARVRAACATRPPRRVFYAIWRDPYMTINADTYIHDVLAVCGGRNVCGGRPERYPTITLDQVAAERPDVIPLPDEPYRFRRAHLEDFAPFGDVPAVRHGRVHLVDGKLFSWYGPRIAETLRAVPALLGGSGVRSGA